MTEKSNKQQPDMTPMVDVTFLLLIFFMVTASFSGQEAIPQSPVNDLPSRTVDVEPVADSVVKVLIDQFNTYQLITSTSEVEAASDQEMRVRLKDMLQTDASAKPFQVQIVAHGEAMHQKVVTAWDAAADNNIENIKIRLADGN